MLLGSKVALVTGAGQGVGQGIALALAAEGAKVAAIEVLRSCLGETVHRDRHLRTAYCR